MARQTLPWSELRAGLLITVALAILAVAILAVGQKSRVFSQTYTISTQFTQVLGLKPAAPVWLAGVDVGRVTSIRFIETQAEAKPVVHVTMSIGREFQELIRADSLASIEGKGLLGDKIIFISVGGQAAPVVPDGGRLESVAPTDFTALLSEAGVAVKNLSALTGDLRGVTETMNEGSGSLGKFIKDQSLYDNLERMTQNLAKLTEKLGTTDGSLIKLLNDPDLYDETTALMRELRTGSGTLAKLIQDPQLYDEARLTLEKAQSIVNRVDNVVAQAEDGEGNVGKLVGDDELYDKMNATIEELRDLIADIKKNPGRYIKLSVF